MNFAPPTRKLSALPMRYTVLAVMVLALMPWISAADYSDNFDRPELGPDWVVDGQSFSTYLNYLVSDSGQRYRTAQLRFVGGAADSVDQYGKLQVIDLQSHTWGFMFRVNGTPGAHYEVHPPTGTNSWRWEYGNPDFVSQVASCTGDASPANGDWIGATIEGTGADTVVKVWRWDSDPDAGGAVNIGANWGVPDCLMTQDPSPSVDTGTTIGIRAYTGNSPFISLADNWSGGDLGPPPVCGNNVVETGEDCDEGGETATCDADCTLPVCGDGWLNLSAGEFCESDTDCLAGETCGSCSCIPIPVCGNSLIEFGEECDDGGTATGDGCDENCIIEACGNGILQTGEECDDGNLTPGDGCDAGCVIEPAPPTQNFSDDFDRATLGPDWAVDAQSFSTILNRLTSDSGQRYGTGQLRYVGGTTNSVNQYGKLQLIDLQSHTWGFMFRVNGAPGAHYEVHPPTGTNSWRWEYGNPDFVSQVANCTGDASPANGDWIGATIEGTGADTVVKVWRWDDDPDVGGGVSIDGNWGSPDCEMTQDPSPSVDTGTTIGIRAYTGGSTFISMVDNWSGGDLGPPPVCGNNVVESGEECDEGGETATCDADCTLPVCGDGLLNVPAGEVCESDTDCLAGETCGSCSCIPIPVCGNSLIEFGEECDDGGTATGDGCDENCILEVCGNGVLQDGEECDDGNVTPGDGCDAGCVIEPAPPTRNFSDDFDRATLGPDWAVDSQSFSTASDHLASDSGQTYRTGQLRYVGGMTNTVDQYGKLQIVDLRTHTWGFMFRVNGTPGQHYEVHSPTGTSSWKWEYANPDFVSQVGNCAGDAPVGNGNWIGATIEGTGAGTVVKVWRWDGDPDVGGAVNIDGNWGPPDCQMTQDPVQSVDTGATIGIRAYTGGSSFVSLADNWSGGDLGPPPVCGNNLVESGEECDEGSETATCDADCTFPVCGDGSVNVPAGEDCESDTDCLAGETCGGCSCIPAPVCGNSSIEFGEECDDGGTATGDGCDENCIIEVCGNAVLQVGEECDDGNLTSGDGCDAACVIEPPPPGQDFSDLFDRSSLGPDWVVDSLSFSTASNRLASDSNQSYRTGQLRYVGGTTNTVNQYGKLQLIDLQAQTWGFMFRVNGTPGAHYEVHPPTGTSSWRWEYGNPDFVSQVANCTGDASVANGDWIGASIEGTGTDTVVKVWRWDGDPDSGGAVNIGSNWGTPDCEMSQDPTTPIDSGDTIGLRAYTNGSPAASFADNWFGGDCGAGTVHGSCGGAGVTPPPSITKILDNSGAGSPNSMQDPDGVVVDDQGNVYVAACGVGPTTEGVFKITPEGDVTQIIDHWGDGGGNVLECPVGIAIDAAGTVYVAGYLSDNAFKRTADGTITEIIDSAGDGSNGLSGALDVALDGNGNVYVSGFSSSNVFRVTPGGSISEVVGPAGDGTNALVNPFGVTAAADGTIFVAGFNSNNVLKRTNGGVITQVMDSSGDGAGNALIKPHDITVTGDGTVYLTGNASDNVFAISSTGEIEVVLDSSGDGSGNVLDNPTGIAVGDSGKLYVASFGSNNAFELTPGGTVTQIIDSLGDGSNGYQGPSDFCVAVGPAGTVYLAGTLADVVYSVPRLCGNGALEIGEVCDGSGESAVCDDDCTLPTCGDGNLNLGAGEQCETDADCGTGQICDGCSCL